jgi:hypothetical protein
MSKLPLPKLAELEQLLPDVGRQYHRLVLVVGPDGSGKTVLLKELCRRESFRYLNVNLALSQRLLDLTSKERPLRERSLLREFQEYAQGKGRLRVFRTEAVQAGFKHAWHERDYRLIVKVAERLPESVLQEDAGLLMYYDNALMRAESEPEQGWLV